MPSKIENMIQEEPVGWGQRNVEMEHMVCMQEAQVGSQAPPRFLQYFQEGPSNKSDRVERREDPGR